VLDISNPVHPKWAGGWNPRQCPVGIHVVGDYAYVANRTSGLAVLDVRNPASPVLVGSVRYPGDAWAVNVAGRYAYVADHPKGFRIIDVKDPAHPVPLGAGSLPQGANTVHAAGDYAFFTEPNAVHVFDVRNPLNPVRVIERRIFGPAERVQIVEHHAYVATGQSSLLIFDLADLPRLHLLDRLMIETNNLPIIIIRKPNGFSQIGNTRMLTNAGLRAFLEKTHPDMPRDMNEIVEALRDSPLYADVIIRTTQISRWLHGLHVTDRYALALGGGGLQVIDVSDVTQPKRIGEYKLEGQTWDVRGAGRYAYVMDNGANIHVIDLGDPAQPVEVAKFDAHRFASRVLAVSEVQKPTTPVPAETYPDVPIVVGAPELSDPQRLPDGAFAFTLSGVANATYVIHATADLVSWVAIRTNTLPADGRLRITDSDATTRPHQFYRAVMQ